MNGKSKCKILKDIRKQIAQSNDIKYVTSECKYQGDCAGTCPKCEAELRYLEEELSKRQRAGKTLAVAGIAAAMVVGMSACTIDRTTSQLKGEIPFLTEEVLVDGQMPAPQETTESVETLGRAPIPTVETELLMGEPVVETFPEGIMGDIEVLPEQD